jgi:Domain of unknown function (DUF4345)
MQTISRASLWINRIVLGAATLIFTMIGLRYLADPVGASAATGATLNTALAVTTTRIGFGGFPLAFAVFTLICLVSQRKQRAGVTLVLTVMITAIVVRLFSIAIDGSVPGSTRLFVPEGLFVLLACTGLLFDPSRVRQSGGVA